jgi:hypothetical protein
MMRFSVFRIGHTATPEQDGQLIPDTIDHNGLAAGLAVGAPSGHIDQRVVAVGGG